MSDDLELLAKRSPYWKAIYDEALREAEECRSQKWSIVDHDGHDLVPELIARHEKNAHWALEHLKFLDRVARARGE